MSNLLSHYYFIFFILIPKQQTENKFTKGKLEGKELCILIEEKSYQFHFLERKNSKKNYKD